MCTRVQGCCCGASEPGALKEDPFLSCNDDKKYGSYDKTGGSAGSCPECKQGLGAFASLSIKPAIMHACGSLRHSSSVTFLGVLAGACRVCGARMAFAALRNEQRELFSALDNWGLALKEPIPKGGKRFLGGHLGAFPSSLSDAFVSLSQLLSPLAPSPLRPFLASLYCCPIPVFGHRFGKRDWRSDNRDIRRPRSGRTA